MDIQQPEQNEQVLNMRAEINLINIINAIFIVLCFAVAIANGVIVIMGIIKGTLYLYNVVLILDGVAVGLLLIFNHDWRWLN